MRIVAYYRMATQAPMRREAEREIDEYCQKHRGDVVGSVFESIGVKRLAAAIKLTRDRSATLVIPRSVHIARNLRFLHMLWQSGVRFHVCDDLGLTDETLQDRHAEAVARQNELRTKVKDALASKKREGVLLGSARPGHWKGRERLRRQGRKLGTKISSANRTQRARDAYKALEPQIFAMLDKGKKLPAIADWLNEREYVTTAGKPFTPTAVWRIVKRAREAV